MKKIIALLLALTLAMGLVACGNNETGNETTTAPATEGTTEATTGEEGVTPGESDIDIPLEDDTTAAPAASNGASELLTNIWNKVPEDNRFFAMGGDFTNPVDGAPGVYSLEDEGLTATLLVPAEQIANVDEAASLVHAMMLNNFTAGAFHVTGDVAAFVEAMHTAISTNRWMCGMPEKLIIAVIDGQYVVSCFGINDAIAPFETALTAAYADADVKYNEAITG